MVKPITKLHPKRGRPQTGNVQLSIRLPVEVVEKLTRLSNQAYATKSQTIAKLVMTAPEM